MVNRARKSEVVQHRQYLQDSYSIGAFHAMKKGILTSISAVNEGPNPFTMSSFGLSLFSVAASTINRKFFTKVQLENGKIYEGVSINTFELKHKIYPLIFAGDAPNTAMGMMLLWANQSGMLMKTTMQKATWISHAAHARGNWSLDHHDASQHGLSRCCYFLAFVMGFIFLFTIFSLVLWGASRP